MGEVTLEMVYQAVQEVNKNLLSIIPHLQLIPYIYVSAAVTVGIFLGVVVALRKMFQLEERLFAIELKVERILEKLEKEEEKALREIEEIEKEVEKELKVEKIEAPKEEKKE